MSPEEWAAKRFGPDADITIVHDDELGTIAQVTRPDGTIETASNSPRP